MASDNDVWTKVYHTSYQQSSMYDKEHLHRDREQSAVCSVHDASDQGLSISLELNEDTKISTRVGDLVTIRPCAGMTLPGTSDEWSICTIRWLRVRDDSHLELGIQVLADDARAVATKATEGVGKGSEYFRGLIIPGTDPSQKQTTLITSPAVYDIGSELVVNTSKQLVPVRLIRLLEGTNSYARFEFRRLA
jgi:hypothetical protein